MNARTQLLDTLGIPDDPAISDDALAVTAAIYLGLTTPGRAATNNGVDAAKKIIIGANMTRADIEDCKIRAIKIWKGER